MVKPVVAFDLGAGSGRAILGTIAGQTIQIEELHRFPNHPVNVGERMHWNILHLYESLLQGLQTAKLRGVRPASLGIDSWAVDFGLLASNGELLGNPYHYRDPHTDGVMEQLCAQLTPKTIFSRTGIQFLPFNTIYQLAALRQDQSPLLQHAKHLLMIPDLLRYFLSGEMVQEWTNATTTQLLNPQTGLWDEELLRAIDVPASLFAPLVQPGTAAGTLRPSVQRQLGVDAIPVLAVAEHDTASAVAAIPALTRSFAYLSCGTWSLMGTEVDAPVMHEEALRCNFTNEGGIGGTYRLLKNVMGLWILQEAKREWEQQGHVYDYPQLLAMAEQEPAFRSLFDPDASVFIAAGPMVERIRRACQQTGQQAPETVGQVVRAILESLALKYRMVFEQTSRVSGQTFEGLHMVGGGIQNRLLCQWTANALRRPVWCGPTEGSALGNLAVQWIAHGVFRDIWEARRTIRESITLETYEPADEQQWNEAYGRFEALAGKGNEG